MRIFRLIVLAANFRVISFVIALLLSGFGFWTIAEVHAAEISPYFAGSGTSADPYLIATSDQLAQLASLVNTGQTAYIRASYRLTANISLNPGMNWTPIGVSLAYPFKGILDGDGHIVTGLNLSVTQASSATGYFGLFGVLNGTVRNLGLRQVNITVTGGSKAFAGGLAGYFSSASVSQVFSTGSIAVNTLNSRRFCN